MSDDTQGIASRVRGAIAEADLTQQAVADILGVERKAVGARVSGRVPFTGSELFRLAVALERPVATLFPEQTQLQEAAS